ncbi:MAG: type II toxin-antitoxin system VapC family toxin [Acidobacteria bacterium]|nr:type II toxin-antitoxin system VapC family toxin [Acidobacteriota bacterium]
MLNLDTHILLFLLSGELRARERRVLRDDPEWSISGIVLWEISRLHTKGRISMSLETPELLEQLRRLHIWSIDLAVARCLSQLDFEADPADQLIAATSLAHGIRLMTRDRKIRASRVLEFA